MDENDKVFLKVCAELRKIKHGINKINDELYELQKSDNYNLKNTRLIKIEGKLKELLDKRSNLYKMQDKCSNLMDKWYNYENILLSILNEDSES